MKKEILRVVTFSCMFIILGTQALLQGSWRVQDSDRLKAKDRSIS